MTMPSIYIHIPFCEVKCGYCDFFSVPRGWPAANAGSSRGREEFDLQEQYVGALCREIDQRCEGDLTPNPSPFKGEGSNNLPHTYFPLLTKEGVPGEVALKSIFFGGGTPSLLRPDLLEKILLTLSSYFKWDDSCEITMETNPKTIDLQGLKDRRSLGINRISMGVQSFNDAALKILGRIHSSEEAKQTIEHASKAGFENINFDLMFALPGQTLSDWKADLETALELGTPHLSCYNLTIESDTAFGKIYGTVGAPLGVPATRAEQAPPLPTESTALAMFHHTRKRLSQAGLPAYEISNFARPGYECRHNQNYWQYGEYLGFGVAAASFVKEEQIPLNPPFTKGENKREYSRAQRVEKTLNQPPFANRENNLNHPPFAKGGRGGFYAVRTTNPRHLQKYMSSKFEPDYDVISKQTAMGEYVMLALRSRGGLSEETFVREFGVKFTEHYQEIIENLAGAPLGAPESRAEQAPPLQYDKGHWYLSERGLEIADSVMGEFLGA